MIDIDFDFRTDTPQNKDPDKYSKTMQSYHKFLYSKPLPNGEVMDLQKKPVKDYLTWKDFRFSSDSIIVEFHYKKYQYMINDVSKSLLNYNEYVEDYLHKSYTLGGEIIFPKMKGSINQSRGCNRYIRDRWDLTLECIRRYYLNIESPIYKTLVANKSFFDLFVDFKGYVDYFYLQDCVSEDYSSVKFWIGDGGLDEKFPLPKTVDEYLLWINKELEFVEKRNKRILLDIQLRGL